MRSTDVSVKTKGYRKPWLYRGSISFLLYIMFMDWFMPAGIGGQSHVAPSMVTMIILTAVLLLVGSLRIPLKYTIGIRAGCAILGLWWMLLPSSGATWILDYAYTLQKDIESWASSGHFRYISEETRALVMVMGWTLFVTSVQMLAIQLRTVLLFGLVTIVYLLCMEILNGIHSPSGMIRAVCCFLLLQSLLQLPRLLGSAEEPVTTRKSHVVWGGTATATVIITIFMTASIASVIPAKTGDNEVLVSIWNKVSGWASSKSGRNAATFATTGYDPAGRDMGAPLVQSKAVYFTATSPIPAYWRGQSRSIYDGRSWQLAGSAFETFEYISTKGRIREEEIEESPYFRLVKQTITLQEPAKGGSDIFAGGVPLRLSLSDLNGEGIRNENDLSGHDKNIADSPYIWSDRSSGNLRFDDKQMTEPVQMYSMDVLLPVQDLTVLRKAEGEDPDFIQKTNLQLPSSLPKRVKELADSITSDASNRYDAVMAVSQYLKSNYTYTLNTRVPGIDKDFVDDFLFVTKKGYCNHFSTSMVILLRSEGIPARYVQGFAPGERDEQQPDQYTVTQGDAHSWVEVYFPGAGWIPFEATPGFAAAPEIQAASAAAQHVEGISKATQLQKKVRDGIAVLRTWIAGAAQPHILAWAVAATLLIAAAAVAGRTYGPAVQLRLRLLLPRRAFPDRERLLHIGAPVWDLLAQRYGMRESGLTLREYIAALPVKDDAVHEEVRRFAADWEAMVYGPESPSRGESIAFLQRCLWIAKSR